MIDIYSRVPRVWCAACGRHVDTIEVDPENLTYLKAYCHGKTETQPLDLTNPKPMWFFKADGARIKTKLQVREHALRGKTFRSAKRNGWRHTLKTS